MLVGQLSCLDKQGNLILANTVQVLTRDTAGESWQRFGFLRSCLAKPVLVQAASMKMRLVKSGARGAGGGQGLSRHPEERLIGLVLVPPQQRLSCKVEVLGTCLWVGATCSMSWPCFICQRSDLHYAVHIH